MSDPAAAADRTAASLDPRCPRRGLVAIGDSITRGSGEAMLGLRMQSWALWLAEALAMPFTCLAVDGARASDALREQAPRLSGPYDLACVYLGVNDVRAPNWEAHVFAHSLERILDALAGEARQLLIVQLPSAIGRPPAPALAIEAANRTIAALAARHSAALVGLWSLRGRHLVLPDAVHLTARGEAQMAMLALRTLGDMGFEGDADRLRAALAPLGASQRLRYLAGAHALAQLRDWRRRASEAAAARAAR